MLYKVMSAAYLASLKAPKFNKPINSSTYNSCVIKLYTGHWGLMAMQSQLAVPSRKMPHLHIINTAKAGKSTKVITQKSVRVHIQCKLAIAVQWVPHRLIANLKSKTFAYFPIRFTDDVIS
jgi:hypothetical protein